MEFPAFSGQRAAAVDARPRTVLFVIFEPVVCLGCSHWPVIVDSVRRCAPERVRFLWRREPTVRESEAVAPLRLPQFDTLSIPWPAETPKGPVYVMLLIRGWLRPTRTAISNPLGRC